MYLPTPPFWPEVQETIFKSNGREVGMTRVGRGSGGDNIQTTVLEQQ